MKALLWTIGAVVVIVLSYLWHITQTFQCPNCHAYYLPESIQKIKGVDGSKHEVVTCDKCGHSWTEA